MRWADRRRSAARWDDRRGGRTVCGAWATSGPGHDVAHAPQSPLV